MISSIKISPGKQQHPLTAILHSFALHFAIMKNIFGAKNLHSNIGRYLHIIDRFYSMYRMTVIPLMSKNI